MKNGMIIKVNMKDTKKMLVERGLDPNGEAQKLLTNEVYRNSDNYTPQMNSVLKRNVTIRSDYIRYKSPYARYQWHGKVMIGSPPKEVTDIGLQYQGAPMRGSFGVTRMWKDKGEVITEKVAKYVGGKSK